MAYTPLSKNVTATLTHPSVTSIADRHQVAPAQVALRWIVQKGHLVTVQSTSPDHQQQDADVFGFQLSDDEMSELDGVKGMEGVVV